MLVGEFFSMYHNEIIESRSNNQIDILLEKVGQNNFEELNNLFNYFNQYLGRSEFIRCLQELRSGHDTIRTRKLREIEMKKDTIIQNMKTYSSKTI